MTGQENIKTEIPVVSPNVRGDASVTLPTKNVFYCVGLQLQNVLEKGMCQLPVSPDTIVLGIRIISAFFRFKKIVITSEVSNSNPHWAKMIGSLLFLCFVAFI